MKLSKLTDTLGLRGAPVRLCCVDTSRNLMAADLETWITVEVGLASRVDVCHCHSAFLRRLRKRAGQQEGCG